MEKKADKGVWWIRNYLTGKRLRPYLTRSAARIGAASFTTPPTLNAMALFNLLGTYGIDKVQEHMRVLAPIEWETVTDTLSGHTQNHTAARMGVSQPTISYALKRAVTRMRYHITRPVFDREITRVALQRVLEDPLDVVLLLDYWNSSCQLEIAAQHNVSQGLVRHRILRSLPTLEQHGTPEAKRFASALRVLLKEGQNVLHPVPRPGMRP